MNKIVFKILLDIKYKPKLYNFDDANIIEVIRKTKDITEFKTMDTINAIDTPCNTINNNIIEPVILPQDNKNDKVGENEKILYLMKTLEPDIYNIYESINDKSIGIALVQTMSDSKLLRTAFRDKNAMTALKFACTYNEKFKKWHAERQL